MAGIELKPLNYQPQKSEENHKLTSSLLNNTRQEPLNSELQGDIRQETLSSDMQNELRSDILSDDLQDYIRQDLLNSQQLNSIEQEPSNFLSSNNLEQDSSNCFLPNYVEQDSFPPSYSEQAPLYSINPQNNASSEEERLCIQNTMRRPRMRFQPRNRRPRGDFTQRIIYMIREHYIIVFAVEILILLLIWFINNNEFFGDYPKLTKVINNILVIQAILYLGYICFKIIFKNNENGQDVTLPNTNNED